MGISKGGYCLLSELKRDHPELGGKVLQLGRQTVFVTPDQFIDVVEMFGLRNPDFKNIDNDSTEPIDDIELFASLGFDSVESIDFSSYESPTYTHDFNHPVPEELCGQYDAVYDGGTLEHIFNFPESLKNIFKLLKVGGLVMHAAPTNNYVDHGFYMFSPTVYYDYYTANGFEILKSYIFEYDRDHNRKPWVVYEYRPGSIDSLSFGGWTGDKLLGTWFVARKLETSGCGIVPQQGTYLKVWKESGFNAASPPSHEVYASPPAHTSPNSPVASSNLKGYIKQNAFLYPLLLPLIRLLRKINPFKRRRAPKPPIVAIY